MMKKKKRGCEMKGQERGLEKSREKCEGREYSFEKERRTNRRKEQGMDRRKKYAEEWYTVERSCKMECLNQHNREGGDIASSE